MVRNKFVIAREFHIQPSEIDKMVFFEYEWLLEDINEFVKQQEKQQKEDNKAFNMPNMNKMMSDMKSSVPKINVPKL